LENERRQRFDLEDSLRLKVILERDQYQKMLEIKDKAEKSSIKESELVKKLEHMDFDLRDMRA
jgi:hypothetical protein